MIFGNIHLFPIFMELTLHRQKTLLLYFNVSGTQTTSKWPANLRASIFGRKKTWGRRKQTSGDPRAKIGGPKRPGTWAAWDPHLLGLGAALPLIFPPPTRFWPKTAYKNSPPDVLWKERRRNTETPKHRQNQEDWRGKRRQSHPRLHLHPLQHHHQRLHAEEGVVHPRTMGL